jgi:Na+/proline symporter
MARLKSKGLVIVGIVLIIISLIFGAYFAPIYTQTGEFGISGIDPDQAVPMIISIVIFFGGVGLLLKGFI